MSFDAKQPNTVILLLLSGEHLSDSLVVLENMRYQIANVREGIV